MSNFINLTPHTIVLRAPDGTDTAIPASGWQARVIMVEKNLPSVNGIPVIFRYSADVCVVNGAESMTYTDFVKTHQLNDRFLVSSMVLEVLGRTGVQTYAPDTGTTAIRENGQVVAVTRLVHA